MDAIIYAHGTPQANDPLYNYSHGNPKALIDIAGKSMIQWVLDAIGNTKEIRNIIICGLSSKITLTCKKPLSYLPDKGNPSANILAGANKSRELDHTNKYVLIIPSSIPVLRPEMIDWFINTTKRTKDDLYFSLCPRDAVEQTSMNIKPDYIGLEDTEVSNINIYIADINFILNSLIKWDELLDNHKSLLYQAADLQWSLAFPFILRRMTLQQATTRVSERIGAKCRAIVWPYAEPCMDVGKPDQLEMLRRDLARQARPTPNKASTKRSVVSQKKKVVVQKRPASARKKPASLLKENTAKPKAKKK